MRTSLVIVVCLLVASSAFSAKRSKIDCSKVSLNKLQPGWGRLPVALQKLPLGASLCGVNAAGVAFVLSDLDAPALEKHYAPLFASVGCKPLTCKTDQFKIQNCACPKSGDDHAGYVQPQPYDQAYQLFFAGP